MKKVALFLFSMLLTILVSAQLSINATGLPVGVNPILSGESQALTLEIHATVPWTLMCDGEPNYEAPMYLSQKSGEGDAVVIVYYSKNPYNCPYGTNYFLASQDNPVYVYQFLYVKQAVQLNPTEPLIDMIGDQIIPDVLIPNYPVDGVIKEANPALLPQTVLPKKGKGRRK